MNCVEYYKKVKIGLLTSYLRLMIKLRISKKHEVDLRGLEYILQVLQMRKHIIARETERRKVVKKDKERYLNKDAKR